MFENISFRLRGGDRVGLIGKNGAGKSTLLKLLSGELEYTEGQVAQEKKDLKIGFLKQDIDFVVGRTILEEAYEACGISNYPWKHWNIMCFRTVMNLMGIRNSDIRAADNDLHHHALDDAKSQANTLRKILTT